MYLEWKRQKHASVVGAQFTDASYFFLDLGFLVFTLMDFLMLLLLTLYVAFSASDKK
jgi:hypothetical protein